MVLVDRKGTDRHPELTGDVQYRAHNGMLTVRGDSQRYQEAAGGRCFLPNDLLDAVGIALDEPGRVGAGDTVDLDACAAGDESENIVAEHWVAAGCHLVVEPLDVLSVKYQDVVSALAGIAGDAFFCNGLLGPFHALFRLLQDKSLDGVDVYLAGAYGRHERKYGSVLVSLHVFGLHPVGEFQLPVAQAPFKQLAAFRGKFPFVGIELQFDLGPCLGGDNPVKPVAVGLLVFAGQDFHGVAGFQLFAKLDRLAVHPAARTARTESGVDVECKVENGGPCWQYPELAGRSEYEYFFVRRGGEVFGICIERVLQGVAHAQQPVVGRLLLLDALVCPVGGGPVFCHVIHAPCAYLHFQIAALAVLDGNVQGLVAARPGGGDPVAQAFGIGLVFLGNVRIHLPAEVFFGGRIFGAVDYEAYGEYVVHPLEGHFLHLHLAPDGPGALGAYLQLVADSGIGEFLLQRFDEFPGKALAVLLGGLQLVGYGPVMLRLSIAEVDVAKFTVDLVKPQLMRNRHVQHHGLQKLLVPGELGEHSKMAHHLQTVGNLDYADPGIGGVLDN